MKAAKYLAIVLGSFFLFAGCQKEFGLENGTTPGFATGSLKNESGNCLLVTINGSYVKDSTLTDSNYVVVQVNFSAPGNYKISTDTSNGFSFQGSGSANNTGLQSIRLTGTGKPVLAQPTNFVVTFDTTVCMFSINVTDSTVTSMATSGDYFPTTVESNWTYISSTTPDTFNVKASATDKNFGQNFYQIFINNYGLNDSDSSFYRKKDGVYYEYGYADLLFQLYGPPPEDIPEDYIFLKDNVPVNSTWESAERNAIEDSVPGKAKIKFTIKAINDQLTIGSVTVDSVIQVQREYMFAPASTGTYGSLGDINYYYAKKIGLVKIDLGTPYSIYAERWEIF